MKRALRIIIPAALILLLLAIYARYTSVTTDELPHEVVAGVDEPPPPHVPPEEEGADPAALEAAAEYAGARNSRALIVRRRGHIIFERYWDGTDFNTAVDTGEFNAAITAFMVGVAIENGKLASIEEPVTNYLPDWKSADGRVVTIRDLLHLQPSRERDPQRAGPELLVPIIEKATGERYAAYLSRNFWRLVGAADAQLTLDREGGIAHGGCCLIARQGDWIRIAELLMTDGLYQANEVVPPYWVRTMFERAPDNPNFGFQVWHGDPFDSDRTPEQSEPYAADDVRYLKGAGHNFLWVVPSLNLAILRTGEDPEAGAGWDDARIPNLIIRGLKDYVPRRPPSDEVNLKDLVPNH